ncbi:hypothetical protein FACS1894180_4540 [Bacteroidia bacterium]|nr:hypothetical protein FACS1894180_4540 [Bacteroidia bacterium]
MKLTINYIMSVLFIFLCSCNNLKQGKDSDNEYIVSDFYEKGSLKNCENDTVMIFLDTIKPIYYFTFNNEKYYIPLECYFYFAFWYEILEDTTAKCSFILFSGTGDEVGKYTYVVFTSGDQGLVTTTFYCINRIDYKADNAIEIRLSRTVKGYKPKKLKKKMTDSIAKISVVDTVMSAKAFSDSALNSQHEFMSEAKSENIFLLRNRTLTKKSKNVEFEMILNHYLKILDGKIVNPYLFNYLYGELTDTVKTKNGNIYFIKSHDKNCTKYSIKYNDNQYFIPHLFVIGKDTVSDGYSGFSQAEYDDEGDIILVICQKNSTAYRYYIKTVKNELFLHKIETYNLRVGMDLDSLIINKKLSQIGEKETRQIIQYINKD